MTVIAKRGFDIPCTMAGGIVGASVILTVPKGSKWTLRKNRKYTVLTRGCTKIRMTECAKHQMFDDLFEIEEAEK